MLLLLLLLFISEVFLYAEPSVSGLRGVFCLQTRRALVRTPCLADVSSGYNAAADALVDFMEKNQLPIPTEEAEHKTRLWGAPVLILR